MSIHGFDYVAVAPAACSPFVGEPACPGGTLVGHGRTPQIWWWTTGRFQFASWAREDMPEDTHLTRTCPLVTLPVVT